MKIALVTTDNREADRCYSLTTPYFGTAPTALLEGLSYFPNAELHVICSSRQIMTSPKKIYDNIWYHSLYVPKWGWLRTAYGGCVRAVRKKLFEIDPDLVHAQGTERDCAISTIFSHKPKLLTIHGNSSAIAKLRRAPVFSYWWLQAKLERFCLPRFDGVICISRYTERLVSCLAKKTWLLPNAVDSKFFQIHRKVFHKVPSILVVATIEHRKNQIGLIKALDSLSNLSPFSLRFFGKCGEDSYCVDFRKMVSSRPWCCFGGTIGRDQLRKEFSEAEVLILPTWEDNCPMVVIEAQAASLPVIASNVGGIPDLIQDGITGLLTDPSRPETMADALGQLLRNPDLREKLSRAGRIQALARSHPRVIAQRHLEIYREVIAAT